MVDVNTDAIIVLKNCPECRNKPKQMLGYVDNAPYYWVECTTSHCRTKPSGPKIEANAPGVGYLLHFNKARQAWNEMHK
jgi:hypothetical protein